MLQLDLTHINVLTKIDKIADYPPLPFNLDFYTEVQDLTYLLPALTAESPVFGQEKFAALNEAIINLIDDFGLVGYETLAVENKKSMMSLLQTIDRAGGYAFGGAEGANDSVWQVAVRDGMGQLNIRDVQERWIDQRDDHEELERQKLEEEQALAPPLSDDDRMDDLDGLRPMPGTSGIKVVRNNTSDEAGWHRGV